MIRHLYFLFALLSLQLMTSFTPIYAAQSTPTLLQVIEKTITVNGKKSRVFDVRQPDGTFGYIGTKGQPFDVIVENKTHAPLVLHWHGITSPNPQDGVPYVTQLPIPPGGRYHYHFTLTEAGTFWMHSHYKLQEQKLMAAPLIIHDPDEKAEKEAFMFIQDFTFTDPKKIYAELRNKMQSNHSSMHQMSSTTPDVNDVDFDAYLTNHKTLQHPDVVRVTSKQFLRLRIINASASSSYFVDLGKLKGTLIAVDGEPIQPIIGSRFQISIGNRLDIRVQIPEGEGAYPILALPEATHSQTGLILATSHASIPKLSEHTKTINPILDNQQEFQLHALHPLSKHGIQRSLLYKLEGDMQSYRWTLNGQEWPYITPDNIQANKRIELVFINKTTMPHPMHFHGHVFQITEIDGKKIDGRQGDTINVMPNSTMKVMFDSNNPGIWMLHCHILYHQEGGMMTTINYEGYPNPFTLQQRVQGEKLYH